MSQGIVYHQKDLEQAREVSVLSSMCRIIIDRSLEQANKSTRRQLTSVLRGSIMHNGYEHA